MRTEALSLSSVPASTDSVHINQTGELAVLSGKRRCPRHFQARNALDEQILSLLIGYILSLTVMINLYRWFVRMPLWQTLLGCAVAALLLGSIAALMRVGFQHPRRFVTANLLAGLTVILHLRRR